MIAEATAGQWGPGADQFQPTLLNRQVEGLAFPHQRQHRKSQLRHLAMERLDNSQGDQVFPMTVADHQQSFRPLADTIRWWKRWLLSGGMAKW